MEIQCRRGGESYRSLRILHGSNRKGRSSEVSIGTQYFSPAIACGKAATLLHANLFLMNII
jgi:hypothetical protein